MTTATMAPDRTDSDRRAVRRFRIDGPQEALDDLRARIANTGHFAAWEQQELLAEEVRAAFRPLR